MGGGRFQQANIGLARALNVLWKPLTGAAAHLLLLRWNGMRREPERAVTTSR